MNSSGNPILVFLTRPGNQRKSEEVGVLGLVRPEGQKQPLEISFVLCRVVTRGHGESEI